MPDPSPHAAADRNLLFGILALQANLISSDALISAMNAWVVDKAKPIGQILVDGEALRAGDRDLLEAMARRHLELHGGDAELAEHLAHCDRCLGTVHTLQLEASLIAALRQASVAGDPRRSANLALLVQRLQGQWAESAPASEAPAGSGDPLVNHLTLHSEAGAGSAVAAGDGPPPASVPQTPAPAGKRLGRFEIRSELGRGGCGVVFHAFDPQLCRDVALKVPRPEALADEALRERFMREGQAAAALDHPHIVPVLETNGTRVLDSWNS
jgi:hypothetical protein